MTTGERFFPLFKKREDGDIFLMFFRDQMNGIAGCGMRREQRKREKTEIEVQQLHIITRYGSHLSV